MNSYSLRRQQQKRRLIFKSESNIMQIENPQFNRRFHTINSSRNKIVNHYRHHNLYPQQIITTEMEWSTKVGEASSSPTEKPERVSHPPTTTLPSHFARICYSRKRFSVTTILVLWLALLVDCSPRYVANGLPLVMSTSSRSEKDVILDSSLLLRGRHIAPFFWWHLFHQRNRLIQETEGDEDGDNAQEATGFGKPNVLMTKVAHPRMKKGLSYLTKYYSESFLNNTPSSGGGTSSANSSAQSQHDSSNHFFGVSTGGSINASREQRFPSVRQKLAFSPPMTTHSAFMSPWSRFSNGGRSPTMRLRWGR